MILVDTSVWVDHLRAGDARLMALLERNRVVMHPMVAGELACGSLHDRDILLSLWTSLPQLPAAGHDEALYSLARNRLWGRGIGYVDLHLLAAVSLGDAVALWTRDKRLSALAGQLGLAAQADACEQPVTPRSRSDCCCAACTMPSSMRWTACWWTEQTPPSPDELCMLAQALDVELGGHLRHDPERRSIRILDDGLLRIRDLASGLGPYWRGRVRRPQ